MSRCDNVNIQTVKADTKVYLYSQKCLCQEEAGSEGGRQAGGREGGRGRGLRMEAWGGREADGRWGGTSRQTGRGVGKLGEHERRRGLSS